MSLKEEDRHVMVALELERVEKTLREFNVQMHNELWSLAANRLYYALFHAVSALLISDQREVGTHRGAVNKLNDITYSSTDAYTVIGSAGHSFAGNQASCQ